MFLKKNYILQLNFKTFKKIDHLRILLFKIKKNIQIKEINRKKKSKLITLLRSPHVNKKSREQFIFNNEKITYQIYSKELKIIYNLLILFIKIIPNNAFLDFKIFSNVKTGYTYSLKG